MRILTNITLGNLQLLSSQGIPQALVPTPSDWGVEIAASLESCDSGIGGDWWDVLPQTGDRHLLLFMADAIGHGPGAAKLMFQTRSLVGDYIGQISAPGVLLGRLNQDLCEMGCSFITAFLGMIDLDSLSITYGIAGHPSPLLLRDGGLSTLNSVTSLPLGIEARETFEEAHVPLTSGDVIVAFTDGIFEATAPDGTGLGMERFEQVVRNCQSSPSDIVQRVLMAVKRHEGGMKRRDDQTMLALRIHR